MEYESNIKFDYANLSNEFKAMFLIIAKISEINSRTKDDILCSKIVIEDIVREFVKSHSILNQKLDKRI